jgi:hypothetical protein
MITWSAYLARMMFENSEMAFIRPNETTPLTIGSPGRTDANTESPLFDEDEESSSKDLACR